MELKRALQQRVVIPFSAKAALVKGDAFGALSPHAAAGAAAGVTRLSTTAVLCLTLVVSCPTLALTQSRFDSWTTENGLPQNSVRDIVQTRDGYLWLATEGGLVRFDGARFVVFDRSVPGFGASVSAPCGRIATERCGPGPPMAP